jgi:hypothetical protein
MIVGTDKVHPSTYDNNVKTDAGSYTAKVTSLAGKGYKNYQIDQSTNIQEWKINKRSVWAVWPEETRFDFDGEVKEVLAELQNVVDGDDVTVHYARNSEHQEFHAGDYTARVTGLEGDDAGNYVLVEKKGSDKEVNRENPFEQSWKIRRCPVTLTWPTPDTFVYNGQEQTYEAEISPKTEIDKVTLAVKYAEDSVNAATDTGVYTAEVVGLDVTDIKHDRHIKASDYVLVGAEGTPLDEEKYQHVWEITSADLEITADNKTKVYGDADPELTYTVTKGTVYDRDDVKVTLTRVEGEDVGTYAILPEITGANNYSVTLVNGTLTITPAKLTVTAKDQTINYGEDYNHNLLTITGFKRGDSATSALTNPPEVFSSYFKNAAAGTYKLDPSGAVVKKNVNGGYNYAITYVSGKLTVNAVEKTLVAKATTKGSKKAALSWNSVTGAASYDVYFSKCNKNGKQIKAKLVATVSGNSYTAKKLKKRTCYKFYVVAKSANGTALSKSQVGHFVAGNADKKNTNAKSLTVNANSVQLNKGGAFQIVATQKKAKSGKKLLNSSHAALLRYTSSNPEVATVSSNGVITATGAGYCKVYVQAVNGLWQEIEVNVK